MIKTYKTQKKLIWKRALSSFMFLVMAIGVLIYGLLFEESLIEFSFYLFIPIGLSFCIHFNHLLNDRNKTLVIDTSSKTVKLTIGQKTQEYPFEEIKKIYYMKGQKDDLNSNAMPYFICFIIILNSVLKRTFLQ